jgi:biopolymer transport protein ExbD
MAFSLPRRLKPLTGPLDMTPLLNVVLLLLIFFLLSSSFVLQPGIKIDPPHVVFEGGSPSSRLVVAISMTSQEDSNGNPLPREPIIYFEDQVVTLDGLRDALDRLAPERNGPPVVLKADKDVPLDLVAQVIDLAFAHRLAVVIATSTAPAVP